MILFQSVETVTFLLCCCLFAVRSFLTKYISVDGVAVGEWARVSQASRKRRAQRRNRRQSAPSRTRSSATSASRTWSRPMSTGRPPTPSWGAGGTRTSTGAGSRARWSCTTTSNRSCWSPVNVLAVTRSRLQCTDTKCSAFSMDTWFVPKLPGQILLPYHVKVSKENAV